MDRLKIVVFVPKSHANVVRNAIGEAGAGKIGNYDFNTFSITGMGRWRTLEGANPYIGKTGEISEEEEERIEFWCEKSMALKVIKEIKRVHPYEEVAIDIYPLISLEEEV